MEYRRVLGQPLTTALFTFGDLTGKPPGDVIAGLEFLRHLRYPNLVRVAPLHGPITAQAQPIPPDHAMADLTFMLDLAKALITIQEHTTTRITFPTDEQTPMHELTHIIWVASVLRGEPTPWTTNSLAVQLGPTAIGMIHPGGPQSLETAAELTVRLNGDEIDFGQVLLTTSAAHLTVSEDHDAVRAVATGPEGHPLILNARRRELAVTPSARTVD